MKTIILKTVTVFILFLFISCSTDEVQELPNTYYLQETALYPEGIIYSDVTEKTYVGSYYKGKIVAIDLYGNMSDFVIDESLVAVVGMTINKQNNTLLVCNSDSGLSLKSSDVTTGILAKVVVYDLDTGEKLRTIDLSGLFDGAHFLNDLITDSQGNTYVTDSFSSVIYKIDTNYEPSLLVSHSSFEVPLGTFGLNGIIYHENNYLIVGKTDKLYKVPLNNPNDVQEINLNSSVNSSDGLLFTNNNELVLVSNNFTGAPYSEAVYRINTSDDWMTGNIIGTVTQLDGAMPTTVTSINNGVFVSFGYFQDLVNPDATLNDSFKLQKIIF